MIEEQTKWKKEISAGGVVYKKENNSVFILLILKQPWRRDDKKQIWTFPKGRIKGDEKLEEVALREVKEEAGVEGKIIEKLGSYDYKFVWEEENISKTVTFYLMEYISGDPKGHDYEVAEARWHELSEAENLLTYKGDKDIFAKAKEFLIT